MKPLYYLFLGSDSGMASDNSSIDPERLNALTMPVLTPVPKMPKPAPPPPLIETIMSKKSKKKKGHKHHHHKSKHRNILDPAFMATMDDISSVFRKMTMKASDSPLMNLMPNKEDLPDVFRAVNYLETRKKRKSTITADANAVDYTEILPKEKGKRGRRKRFLEGEEVSPVSEQCLPLKKRHKLLCAAALSLPAVLPQMSPISSSSTPEQSPSACDRIQSVSSTNAGVSATPIGPHTGNCVEKRKVGRPRKQNDEPKSNSSITG